MPSRCSRRTLPSTSNRFPSDDRKEKQSLPALVLCSSCSLSGPVLLSCRHKKRRNRLPPFLSTDPFPCSILQCTRLKKYPDSLAVRLSRHRESQRKTGASNEHAPEGGRLSLFAMRPRFSSCRRGFRRLRRCSRRSGRATINTLHHRAEGSSVRTVLFVLSHVSHHIDLL